MYYWQKEKKISMPERWFQAESDEEQDTIS